MDLKTVIRNIPDFPKKGIVFRDITTLLKDPEAFRYALDSFYQKYKSIDLNAVAGIESRGFIFGAPLAYMLKLPFILIRKPGKLPAETVSQSYQLEYGTDSIEIHRDALKDDDRVIIIDDLLATGGTAAASAQLVEQLGAEVVSFAFVIELSFLKGREKLSKYEVLSLVDYQSE